jgi:hypothetical protein
LQTLFLPMQGPSELEPYSSRPEHLNPRHCGICHASGGEGPLDAYGLTPELIRHVQEVHGLSPAEYRRKVLTSTASAGLVEVPAQVLRSCLEGYKIRLSDATFKAGICACCAREHQRSQLRRVTFPSMDTQCVPAWLEWSQECWEAVPIFIFEFYDRRQSKYFTCAIIPFASMWRERLPVLLRPGCMCGLARWF